MEATDDEHATGQEPKSPRREFFYFSDDCGVLGMRYENWKFVAMEQRTQGTAAVWADPFVRLHAGKVFDLRADPNDGGHAGDGLRALASAGATPAATGDRKGRKTCEGSDVSLSCRSRWWLC
jgi:arylsulfatase A-like enzyme